MRIAPLHSSIYATVQPCILKSGAYSGAMNSRKRNAPTYAAHAPEERYFFTLAASKLAHASAIFTAPDRLR
jgi:hypothetical protein